MQYQLVLFCYFLQQILWTKFGWSDSALSTGTACENHWVEQASGSELCGLYNMVRMEKHAVGGTMPFLWHELSNNGAPDVLLLQLDKNEFASFRGLDLTLSIKADLQLILDSYPCI